jgi:predicted unusual protein kinase regulating ubiquinone biosynthesis (AarF/ABC1/UbiB family)
VETVVKNLSELKGIPQKIGQLISMDFSEYIPEEYREKFSKLQDGGQAIETEKRLEQLKIHLGDTKFSHILDFENIPLGAGSIGQVHKALLHDKKIVLKVRYPNIEKTLSNDLSLMLPMAYAYELFRPQSKDLTILLDEARIMLLQEMNYEMEASFLNIFNNALKGDSRFCVPVVFSDYSNKNIICMEHFDGINLKKFIQIEIDLKKKIFVAHALLDLFIEEFFQIGFVQTDPNFANYLVTENNQIVLLDFGATKEFKKDFRDLYFSLLKSSYEKNTQKILDHGERLGLIDRKDNEEAVNLFVDFMIDVMSFFRPENNPIDFSNEIITKRLFENGWALWKKQRISVPNSNLVFLHRKLGGLFSLLKESKISIDLYPMWEKIKSLNTHEKNNF